VKSVNCRTVAFDTAGCPALLTDKELDGLLTQGS
jgi:hypothetical protein